nr:ribonuclease H-like domain-containing protein [Tanacetum cinerariifolium]
VFVTRDSLGLFSSQQKYAVEISEKTHMLNCNPSRTPVDTESKLANAMRDEYNALIKNSTWTLVPRSPDIDKYAVEILEKTHMLNCNPSRTPVDTESKLGVGSDPVSDLTLYRSLAEPHLSALKRILRYVQGTLNYDLQLFSSSTTDLVAYSDADWAGCPTTRRSTSGDKHLLELLERKELGLCISV